ncbi:hypothetical protein PtrSN002B_009140 [Pyrenophora tritici-repentis]|uniref:Uncharacterized protein n=2 Tax=Pyrenophora tritici-repentis TaxID=45151 RepID=A0A2W1GJZ7_9PLEO|nr:uncharacterized protein PTRG_06568 [Pyrenophora tritici-repentis Pt-1C-BFP]KAA8613660.1 hypothetical protein PtrV1_12568 [Pyrenophora tritici-repentis]EDU49488.1 predicted protein [Pyrenophora tritici-repentis Pt-1C-BFP]KAF7445380.1 hypothetical protein A1F99_103660 [Pyrenophora tritici-repentis]KAF7565645.1 hypothetical protein PtrM4_050790 [Pyrenophora tritici-repentis]KAG9380237.1 hypothetical protein A1F94_009132 [Pyrenophora tritici-repentis]
MDFDDDDWDLDSDDIRINNEDAIENLKRKPDCDYDSPYDPNRVRKWTEDPYHRAKHQKLRPDRDEAVHLFDYKPIDPSDSISLIEEDEQYQDRIATMKEEMVTKRQELEDTIPNHENLPFADIVTDNFEFSGPIVTTTWDKRWVHRRRLFEARWNSRRNSL